MKQPTAADIAYKAYADAYDNYVVRCFEAGQEPSDPENDPAIKTAYENYLAILNRSTV